MPTKKSKKAKIVKKVLTKKAPAKKVVAKKAPAKKLPVKKVAAKIKKPLVNKSAKKPSAKPKQKIIAKKLSAKKVPEKKVKKVEPEIKKAEPKKPPRKLSAKAAAKIKAAQPAPTRAEIKKSIASAFLSKSLAKEKNIETAKLPEKKSEIPTKSLFIKKHEGKNKTVFKIGDYAVYPSHGIGKIVDIEKTFALGHDLSCYLMYFEREKLTIKIPMNSADKIGLRHLISKSQMDEVFAILRSGVKKLKGMWSRRAQEYETKINSGDIILLAEVLRDLTRDIEDSERSYSERIIYETAIHRLANEYSVIYGIDFEEAKEKVIVTAKDKLSSEPKAAQKDEFDEFDLEGESEDEDEEESEDEDEEDEDEDDDYDYDDEDDDAPKKKKKKK